MHDNDTIDYMVTRFTKITNDLTSLGDVIDNDQKIRKVIRGLCNASIPQVQRCYCNVYTQVKNPYIYALSISTCKNQSTEVRIALYIPTYEYNYKVITGCDTILQEYYITGRHNCENTKRYTSMNNTKGAHELQKGNSRDGQGTWRDRASNGLSMIHATAALL